MSKVFETPVEYSGQWIAWNHDHTEVIAHSDTLRETKDNAEKTGEKHYWLYKVPDKDVFYGGAALFQ